jgi:SAM-dependent methyltransferase
MLKPLIKRLVPPSFGSFARGVLDDAMDWADRWRGRSDDRVPPRRLIHNIGGSFVGVGQGFLRHFVELGGLKPDDKVLDVGCGVGRMAVPLTGFLTAAGGYEGFDIDAREIEWCTRHITAKHPNFRFRMADLYSKRYNPKGTQTAPQFKFPYADESFDFVFMTSVFTHILPAGVENYLSEVSRVLKGNGRSLITYFLLNEESMTLLREGHASQDFKCDHGPYWLVDEDVPESAVAYDEGFVRNLYLANGLAIVEPVRYGAWCQRPEPFDYQDIVVARKQQSSTTG